MKKQLSKTEAEKQIEEFFSNLNNKTVKDVKKIKRFAMAYNIKLGEKRKLFCKKCFSPHNNSSISVKEGFVTIMCGKCNYKNRWKIK
jgi:RNase P subunit RPR2